MRISVKEAAKILGVTPQFVRMGIRTGRLPIGTAVKMSTVWTYYITSEAVEKIKNAPFTAMNGATAYDAEKGTHLILTQGMTKGNRSWESS